MNFYPIMLNITDLNVTVIGGGDVAYRKTKDLLGRGANVTLIASDICFDIHALVDIYNERLELIERPYKKGDCRNSALVFSATNNTEVNKKVFEEAKELNIFINAVDDPPNCSFIIPSYFQRDDLIISVSTSGASPSMSARLRREIEKVVPDNIEETLRALKKIRAILQENEEFDHLEFKNRGKILKTIVKSDELLKEMINHYHKDTLDKFISGIIEQL